MTTAIETFFGAWSMADADARLAAISSAVSDAVTYADPRTSDPLSGAAAVSEYVGMFAASAPGATADVVDTQEQAGLTRATIAFRMPGGMEQMGQYFVEMADGKLTRLTGFVGTGTPG